MEAEDFDKLNREEIVAFHKEHYKLENAQIILAGNIGSELLKFLRKSILQLSNLKRNLSWISLPVQSANPTIIFDERPDSLQSAIRIGKQIIHKTHPDYIELSSFKYGT